MDILPVGLQPDEPPQHNCVCGDIMEGSLDGFGLI